MSVRSILRRSFLFALALSALDAQVMLDRSGRMAGVRRYHSLSIDADALLEAARTGNSTPFPIDGQWHLLKLSLNDMRGPGYKAILITPAGDVEIPTGPPTTYKGKLDDDPRTEVRLSISGRRVRGFASFGKSWYFIEPVQRVGAPPNGIEHVAYSAADAEMLPSIFNDTIPGRFTPEALAAPLTVGALLTATIILDGDAEFYNVDPASWIDRQASVLNDVEGIYNAEVQVHFRLRLQAIHTSSADFIGTSVCSNVAQDLVAQVNTYWARRTEGRDLVHVFSGKNFDSGVIGCSYEPSLGTTQSASITQQISKGANTSYVASALQKSLLVAHEIGHVFNGDHSLATSAFDATCNCYDDTIMSGSFSGTSTAAGGHRIVNHFSDANKQRMIATAQAQLCAIGPGSADTGAAGSAFADDYFKNGGPAMLGCASDTLHVWGNGNIQDFTTGTGTRSAILIGNGQSTAAWLHDSIWTYYLGAGGPGLTFSDGTALGYPVQDEAIGPPSSFSGSHTLFSLTQNGEMQSYTSGAHLGQTYVVHGLVLSKWAQACLGQACRSGGPLGMPIAEEAAAPSSPQGTAGRSQSFENGQIYRLGSGPRVNTSFFVEGAIAAKYASVGGSSSSIGFPVSDEYAWNGGLRNDFEGGYISWTSAGGAALVPTPPETVSKPLTPSGSQAGAPQTSYVFLTGGAISSRGNPVRYKFSWGDGTDSGWLVAGVTSAAKTWSTAGTFSVTALAAPSDLSVTSPASDALTVSIAFPALAAPALSTPADGATGVLSTASLTWSAVTGSSGYTVYFGASNPPPLLSQTASTSYQPALAAGTTYFWTVASRDPNHGNAEAKAQVRSFATASASIAFNSSPAGAPITVDGQTATAPFTLILPNGPHTITSAGSFAGAAGTQYVFAGWGDGVSPASRTITVGAGQPANYIANFTTQYQLTLNASPSSGGSVTPASGQFYNAGTLVQITASAAAGSVFGGWVGSVASASSPATTVTMTGPQTVTANFNGPVFITFQTSPTGLPVTVDGATQNGGLSVALTPGAHSISVASPQSSGGIQNTFASWSDGGAQSHSITVVANQAATFTASFTTQYQLAISASPSSGGTISPASGGYYVPGSAVPISASAAAGSVFSGWSGAVASPSSLSTTVTMTGPQSVTAIFNGLVPVTFQTSPAGLPITVDGATQNGGFTVALTPGQHSVSVSSLTSNGVQNTFASWSDGGAPSHSISVVANQPATLTANFATLYQLITSASPPSGGTVAPASGGYFAPGSAVPISASAAAGSIFSGWSGAVASPSSRSTTVTMTGPQTVTAIFNGLVPVTFQTSPAGLPMIVDGTAQSGGFTLALTPGQHSVSVSSQTSGGVQNTFASWSDGGAQSHAITVFSGQPSTFTASFATQYQLTILTSPPGSGTVAPASGGYYASGSTVPISASPSVGFAFSNWSGNVTSATSAFSSVAMNSPQTVTVNFSGSQASSTVFIRQLYRDLLNREPDVPGMTFWQGQIAAGVPRAQVASNFFTSPEFSSSGLYIIKLYLGVLGRDPDFEGWSFWFNSLRTGLLPSSMLDSFLGSPEFVRKYGNLSNADFVTLVYRSVLGRDPDPTGLQYYLDRLSGNLLSRGSVFNQFLLSSEYDAKVRAQAYSNLLYMGFLRRTADPTGLTFWIGSLSGGSSLTSAIDGFITSAEYQNRLAQAGP